MDDMDYDPRCYLVTTRADHIPGPPQGQWTYDEYATIPDDGQRYEVIDGVLYVQGSLCAPKPLEPIIDHLITYFEESHHFAAVYSIPFEVKLSGETKIEPDLAMVFKERNERGSGYAIDIPDLIMEVVSPNTRRYDRDQKYRAYACAGVKEYWFVDPVQQTVEIIKLANSNYPTPEIFSGEQLIHSPLLPDFSAQIQQLFDHD